MHLARERPDLCALDIRYARGLFWNGGPWTFERSAPPSGPHVAIPEATEAVVLCRRGNGP
jgi:hypothetical protein